MAEYRGWGNKKTPCLNCQSKMIGCHSSCTQYKAYNEASKRNRAIKLKNNEAEYNFKNAIHYITYKQLY